MANIPKKVLERLQKAVGDINQWDRVAGASDTV